MLDAYSIKKMAPRILIGIILINLSLYLVVAVTEVTRIAARGAGDLITQPFVDSDEGLNFTVSLDGGRQALAVGGVLLGGYFFHRASVRAGGGLSVIKDGIFGAKNADNPQGTLKDAVHIIVFSVIVPILLILLAVFVTLIFRQGLLLFLAMVAPIACALYILPSTDKYFKKWWELFSKTLLMYPIIMAIFALSDVLASIIISNNHTFSGTIAGLVAMFAPLALIPFSFKFAGGAMTAIYGAMTTGRGKLNEMGPLKRNREKARQTWDRMKTQGGAETYRRSADNLKKLEDLEAKKKSGATLSQDELDQLGTLRRTARRNRRRMSTIGIDVFQKEAEYNKQSKELADLIIGMGDDERFRAATATMREEDILDEHGNATGQKRQVWRSLGGKEFTGEQVKRARASMGNNQYLYQQALAHEINKATQAGEWVNFENELAKLQEEVGFSDETMNSALIGAGYQMKPKTLLVKNSVMDDGQLQLDGAKFVAEEYATTGTYQSFARTAEDHRMNTIIATQLLEKQAKLQAQGGDLSDKEKETLSQLQAQAKGYRSVADQSGGFQAAAQQSLQASGMDYTASSAAEVAEEARRLADLFENLKQEDPNALNPQDPDYATLLNELNQRNAARAAKVQEVLAHGAAERAKRAGVRINVDGELQV